MMISMRANQAPLTLSSSIPSINFRLVWRETPGKTMKVTAKTQVMESKNYHEIKKLLFIIIKNAIKGDIIGGCYWLVETCLEFPP